MTEMPDDFTPDDDDAATQRINGVIDVPRPGRVAGWAIDRSDPEAAVTVTVLREGRVVGEVRADAHRPDLERGGIGTGRYGFALDLDPPLEPGFEFTVTAIARASDGTTGEIRPVGRARPAEDAGRRLAERTFAEVTQLRGALLHLSGRQDRASEMRALEILDRVEVVQARLEQTLAGIAEPEALSRGRGVALAVAAALALGAGSLALGVWSMLAG
jgi:hypothetical protein